MITRGKSSLRRGKLSTVVVPATYEPLHFLYPRWANSGLLPPRFYSVRSPLSCPRRPKPCETFSGPPQRRRSVDNRYCRWLSHEGFTASENNFHVRLDEPDLNSASEPAQNGSSIDDERQTANRLKKESSDREKQQLDHGIDNSGSDESLTESIRILRPLSNQLTVAQKKQMAAERIRSLKQVRWSGNNLSYSDAAKLRYRQHVLKWRQQKPGKKTPPPHWTEIMAKLERMRNEMPVTPESTVHEQVLVREEIVVLLSGDVSLQENIWTIDIRNGCQVRVLHPTESEGIYRKMIISGTTRAIELVKKKIKHIDEQLLSEQASRPGKYKMSKPPFPIIPSMLAFKKTGQPLPLIRGYFDQTAIPQKEPLPLKPRFSSVRSFAEFVEQAIISPTEKRTDPKDSLHHNKVAKRLLYIFTRSANSGYLSTYALNTALEFLLKHECLDSARAVFRASRGVATVKSYNLFLLSTARRQDAYFFESVLSDMESDGVQPNGDTWVAFMESLISAGPRHQVMQRMAELGFLKDRTVEHAVVTRNIGMMLFPHLQSGLGIQDFLESLGEKYGMNIISTTTMNRILEEVLPKRDPELLVDIFSCFQRYGIAPNGKTFDMAFDHFLCVEYAMKTLWEQIQTYDASLTESNFEAMFTTAITSNMYNTCRVIWRYACLKGLTSPLMRQIVLKSLAGKNEDRARNPDQLEFHLGAIVVGLEYQSGVDVHGKASKMVPREHARSPIPYLLQCMRTPKEHGIRGRLVHRLIADDVEQGRSLDAVLSFSMMLDAAIKLDKSTHWHSEDPNYPAMNKRTTLEILKEMVQVPVERHVVSVMYSEP